jgi:glucokinase
MGLQGMATLLVGDIGGTNTRLLLIRLKNDTTAMAMPDPAIYASAGFTHLNDIAIQFLEEARCFLGEAYSPPVAACFAIAGPVKDDTCQLTNLSWQLDARQMEEKLGIKHIRLINDFAAVGYGIPALQSEDVVVLQDCPAVPQAAIAVLGAGTGLGEALLIWQQDRYEVLPTEGGHADYAPRTDIEIGLLQFLRSRHGRVSVERVVSGQGIFAIYEYLRTLLPLLVSLEVETQLKDPERDRSDVIAKYALAPQRDTLCAQALDLFVANYGAEAGNLALKSLPYGGLYLAGGVGAKILPKLQGGVFMESFLDKGRMRSILKTLPVSLIVNPKVGLMGAALYAKTLIQQN